MSILVVGEKETNYIIWLFNFLIRLNFKLIQMQDNKAEDTTKLFVTEIPLEATMSDVLKAFEKFGKVRKVAFVPNSGDSIHNGHAFLEFEDAESGKLCLEQSRNSKSKISEKMLFADAISIKGCPVVVSLKVAREEILGRQEKKDKQNLHLLYEGRITADDQAAEGVPHEEMLKRKRLWENKIDKLKDTNNKISTTRLAVFNVPKTAGQGQIRKIFAIAPKKYARTHKKEKLSEEVEKSQIRIIDVRKIEGQDDLAFVEFTKPEHALAALRHVNNNPNYFTGRRLIVEFAIVNNQKMKRMKKKQEERKKLREQRFADKEAPPKEAFDDDDDDVNNNDEGDFGNDTYNDETNYDPSLAPADDFDQ